MSALVFCVVLQLLFSVTLLFNTAEFSCRYGKTRVSPRILFPTLSTSYYPFPGGSGHFCQEGFSVVRTNLTRVSEYFLNG